MAQTGTPTTSSLLKPLGPAGVLIEGEVIKYNERDHWAVLIQPFLETLAVLTFITMFAGGLPNGAFGGFIGICALGMALYRFRKGQWKKGLVYGVIVGLLIGFVIFGIAGMAILAILATAARFIYRAGMWAFYIRLYITNRRVIKASGFLGARIDTMPLTRVTDINFQTSVPGELLGYGLLRVETAGQDQALGRLPFLDKPNRFYEILIDLSTAAVGSVTDKNDDKKKKEEEAPASIDSDDGAGTLDPDNI